MRTESQITGMADRIVRLWPLIALLVGGIVGYLKLQWTVEDVSKAQESWKKGSEERREKNHEEIDAIKTRLVIIETKAQGCENRR